MTGLAQTRSEVGLTDPLPLHVRHDLPLDSFARIHTLRVAQILQRVKYSNFLTRRNTTNHILTSDARLLGEEKEEMVMIGDLAAKAGADTPEGVELL